MSITLEEIKQLRTHTGAGIKDCKTALQEAQGNFDVAVDLLRKRGQKIAAKRAGNTTSEGIVFASITEDSTYGVIVGLGCETDFVAKNAQFKALGQLIASQALLHRPTDTPTLLALKEGDETLQEKLVALMGIMGENITLVAYTSLEAPHVASYIHTGSRLATLVGFDKPITTDPELAEDMAIQVAVNNPQAITKEGVDPTLVAKERQIAQEQTASTGKPPAIVARIVDGKMQKFYEACVLLMQPFYKGEKWVEDHLKQAAPGVAITGYHRIIV